MKYEYSLNAERANIVIMRVENGWVVRTHHGIMTDGKETPLRVAETPEALLEIIGEWARSQHKPISYEEITASTNSMFTRS